MNKSIVLIEPRNYLSLTNPKEIYNNLYVAIKKNILLPKNFTVIINEDLEILKTLYNLDNLDDSWNIVYLGPCNDKDKINLINNLKQTLNLED